MVTTTIRKSFLFGLIGKKLTDTELEESLHQIKAPIDSKNGDELIIEITGDRPDLLSAEGIARSLKGYLGIEVGLPKENFSKGNIIVNVDAGMAKIREFIVAAVVDGLLLTDDDFKDLIQIQEKLTLTHGRKRKKVAIGLHDLGPLSAPFHYRAVDPNGVSFIPLGKLEKMTLNEILQKHEKGIEYGWILKDKKKMPVIFDSKNEVLSFPPIINGALSQMSVNTKSVFIDITGEDIHACNVALNILCRDFEDRGGKIKSVSIKYPDKTILSPQTSPQIMDLKVDYANSLLGTRLEPMEIISCLGKQRISAKIKNEGVLECHIPPYRADFLHPSDLVEEAALGFGFNNFEIKLPSLFTKGGLLTQTKVLDDVENYLIGAGFLQVNTPILTNGKKFARAHAETFLIKINNPISEEYENVRSELLPHLIETLSKNTHNPYPQMVFEAGLAAIPDNVSDVRARNELHVAGIIAHSTANLTQLSSVLLGLLKKLKINHKIMKSELKMFIPGRCGKIHGKHGVFGHFGEIHPAVLENFKIEVPLAAFELNLEGV